VKTANQKFKIGDRVRIKHLPAYKDKLGVVQSFGGPMSDFDWEVKTDDGCWVPVHDFELENA